MNPKIQRNFEVFRPCDFIAAITQHIPDKGFQLVCYYGWYSNPDARARSGRGQRDKRAAEEAKAAGQVGSIDKRLLRGKVRALDSATMDAVDDGLRLILAEESGELVVVRR